VGTGSRLDFRPLTAASWADFEGLFGARGAPNYCWCMLWRATPEERRHTRGAERKPQMRRRIEAGVPVGLLAYEKARPVAWVSLAPRETFHRLGGPEAKPDEIVWSLTCMFVPRPRRGHGLTRILIEAAIAHARRAGATVLEAYPVAPDSPTYRYMGRVPAFVAAGFEFVEMAGKRRHVMRLELRTLP
jgi:GNAT superfamily N-acetyltransferase